MNKLIQSTAIALISLPLLSCMEDPSLVRKHGEQEAEIAKLKGELAFLEERLKTIPDDRSAEYQQAQQEGIKLESQRVQLAAENIALEEKLRQLQSQYDAYKQKYSVR
ncbi:hypothetical protein ACFSSA_12525 [Luteolibacter algae]|uniref:Uncharacterized protein n=1 Tax=Luteolibacter algae TaxID=454151 RepID=A0ABW5DDN2_9BACT